MYLTRCPAPFITMSTDKKRKQKRGILHVERLKIIEYACTAVVVLLFIVMAVLYGRGWSLCRNRTVSEPTVSPVPTDDRSIRGMNVFSALDDAGFSVETQTDGYVLTTANGVRFTMEMRSDDKGIKTLSFETPYCPDPEEEGELFEALRAENDRTEDALRDLFDCMMPVFHRPISDSETIVQQCGKVVLKGNPYAKRLGDYSVRIQSDLDAIPQTVTITLIRDA